MFELQHGECPQGPLVDEHGYVETDPTGRYGRFQDVLGKGATKTVYRAFDELNGMEVAWNQAKICNVMRSPEALQRLYSEVNLLSTLDHDSIIRFNTSWVDVGKRTFNFITEMFTSGTLREYRQRYRRVDIRAVKNWAAQILHGLVYLHGHDPPVIHRDLKCDNIFVNGHLGQVKIGDLGLASVLRGSQSAHSVIGTPEFMAPELYEEEYNALVDIYSFGMCVLEMLTGEYPYSECSNPAQIYKKVTSGKLPDAFYRVQDPVARRFIGRCLENASKRSSARELLLDPFLSFDDGASKHNPIFKSLNCKASRTGTAVNEGQGYPHSPVAHDERAMRSNDMRITGKMNPEDDTIFLRVQIANKDGHGSNIYFPFDIISDTPIDVANEMVKELEITDRHPSQIAEVIAHEISALVPNWKERAPPPQDHHIYTYGEEDDGFHHPFYYPSSPGSSHGSFYGQASSQAPHLADWLREDMFPVDDDACSENSMYSGKYSNVNYNSGGEQDTESGTQRRELIQPFQQDQKSSSRFCPEENSRVADHSLAVEFHKQCNIVTPDSPRASGHGGKKASESRKLMRNRSLVDMRSQLLHRSLVEEVKKRLFKTVGAVEKIGFQMPSCDVPGKASSSRGASKKKGFTWGRN